MAKTPARPAQSNNCFCSELSFVRRAVVVRFLGSRGIVGVVACVIDLGDSHVMSMTRRICCCALEIFEFYKEKCFNQLSFRECNV